MTDPDENLPYRVEPEGDGFRVVDWEGNVIITSTASANADQYATLLNQAYRRGLQGRFSQRQKARLSRACLAACRFAGIGKNSSHAEDAADVGGRAEARAALDNLFWFTRWLGLSGTGPRLARAG